MRRTLLPLVLAIGTLIGLRAPGPTSQPAETNGQVACISTDPNDWPTYNRDFLGTRHNRGEKSLGRESVGQLVEKWRFPSADSSQKIGVVHATVVVNGHVYFGTETTPTFYKLTPDGKV